MTARETNGARSLRIEAATISEALEEWLGTLDLTGVDRVRAQVAVVIASKIDDPQAPAYVLARLMTELRACLDSITAQPRTQRSVERLLAEVAG